MLTKSEAVWKAIPAARLRELLTQVPDDALIAVSPVQELAVLTPDERYTGYISISDEEWHPAENDHATGT